MARLRRFEGYRFVGRRDTMRVYDTDDEAQGAELAVAEEELGLADDNLLQVFAPDGREEAANRGFEDPTLRKDPNR